jgi:hypothetical protein
VGSRLNGQMAPSCGPLEITLAALEGRQRARETADLWQAHANALMLGGSPSPKCTRARIRERRRRRGF